jgi:hypothetical protein
VIDNPRVDLLIAKHGRVIVIIAVIIGILAVLATGWAAANPQTVTTDGTDTDHVETEVVTNAEVVQDGLWESGTDLEDNPLYIQNDTPVVTLEPRTTVPDHEGETTVEHRVAVRYEAIHEETAFWEERDEIQNETATIENGVATSQAPIDVESAVQRQQSFQDELGSVGEIELSVVVDVHYEAGEIEGDYELSTPLLVDGDAYWFEEPMEESVSHDSAVHEETTEPQSTLIAGFGLLALAAFGVAIAVTRRETVNSDVARRRLHERRYDEWISQGAIPMWVGDHHISLDTLEDVVDVAIDTNKRVVHDRQRELFAVISDNVVYYYSERGLWDETAWPEIGLTKKSNDNDGGRLPILDEENTFTESESSLPDIDDDDGWKQL